MFLFSLEVEDLWKIFDRNRVQVKKCRKSFGDTVSIEWLLYRITSN